MKKTIFTLFLTAIFALGIMNVANASDCDIVFDFENASSTTYTGVGVSAINIIPNPYSGNGQASGKVLEFNSGNGAYYIMFPVATGKLSDNYNTIEFDVMTESTGINGKQITFAAGTSSESKDFSTTNTSSITGFNGSMTQGVWQHCSIAISSLNTSVKDKAGTIYFGLGIYWGDSKTYCFDNIRLTVAPANCISSKLKPVISTNPTLGSINCGQTLADVTLTGGEATYTSTITVAGSFAFDKPTTKLQFADNGKSYKLVFTPTDNVTYDTVSVKLPVTVIDNGSCPVCETPAGYFMITCFDDGFEGFSAYKAENSSSVPVATVVADPTDASNQVIKFENKDWAQYLRLNVTLPCTNRTLGDYIAVSYKIYYTSNWTDSHYIGINGTMTNSGNGNAVANTWTTIEKAIPSAYSSSTLTTFTLEIGARTNAKTYYIDNVMLKEKDNLPACNTSGTATSVIEPSTSVMYVANDYLNIGKMAQKIQVFNVDSRMILSAENCTMLNISSLSSGVYIAKVIIDNQTKIIKFVR